MIGLATLTMYDWVGELPRLGDYLKTAKGRTAFMIVEIRRPVRHGAAYVARFRCERHGAGGLPSGAVVHSFRWMPRGRTA